MCAYDYIISTLEWLNVCVCTRSFGREGSGNGGKFMAVFLSTQGTLSSDLLSSVSMPDCKMRYIEWHINNASYCKVISDGQNCDLAGLLYRQIEYLLMFVNACCCTGLHTNPVHNYQFMWACPYEK